MANDIFPDVEVRHDTRFGRPVIKGTRVPIGLVVGKIAGGMTVQEVGQEYDLTREQVYAALHYAAQLVAEEELAVGA